MKARAAQKKVRVALAERSYDIHVGSGALAEVGRRTKALGDVSRAVVVTNPTVRALYGRRLARSLRSGLGAGVKLDGLEMPDGERYKNLRTVGKLYDGLLALGADRNLVVVALGGGVVGDTAGFAAATLLRGVRLVMVPTTLLAQVDSSVGGKTGVNSAQGKNLIGAFHQPSLVVADTSTLQTLSTREYRAGLAEVVKYGVILSRPLFTQLEKHREAVKLRDVAVMTDVVARCCKLKAEVVGKDETEAGLRRILNFGHTVGHAIEKVTRYRRFLHGEAVAMGMAAAMRLSARLDACDVVAVERLETLLADFGLRTRIPANIDRKALVEAIGFDKKVTGKQVRFIVAKGIGSCGEHALRPRDIAAVL